MDIMIVVVVIIKCTKKGEKQQKCKSIIYIKQKFLFKTIIIQKK